MVTDQFSLGSSIRLWEELPQPCTRAQIDDCGVIIDLIDGSSFALSDGIAGWSAPGSGIGPFFSSRNSRLGVYGAMEVLLLLLAALCVAAALKLQESDEERETAHIAYICGMIEA